MPWAESAYDRLSANGALPSRSNAAEWIHSKDAFNLHVGLPRTCPTRVPAVIARFVPLREVLDRRLIPTSLRARELPARYLRERIGWGKRSSTVLSRVNGLASVPLGWRAQREAAIWATLAHADARCSLSLAGSAVGGPTTRRE